MKNNLLIVCLLAVLISSCSDDTSCTDGIQNGDETGVDCGGALCEPCFGVGLLGEAGGVIFFDKGVFSDGWRYLEAANEDVVSCNIGPERQNSDLLTRRGIGFGQMNSDILFDEVGWNSEVRDYTVNGFSDWFIPSEDELSQLRDQRDLIPNLELGGECGCYFASSLLLSSVNNFGPRVLCFDSNEWVFTNPGQQIRPIRQF